MCKYNLSDCEKFETNINITPYCISLEIYLNTGSMLTFLRK